MAHKLDVAFKDATALDLAQTIDNINKKFQTYVQSDTVNTLYKDENMKAAYWGEPNLNDAPFEFTLWNRKHGSDVIDRPVVLNGYKIFFVHGHDCNDYTEGHIFNLDNSLGEGYKRNEGRYSVLYKRKCNVVIQQFFKQLAEFKIKEEDLRKRHHITAADCALNLHRVLLEKHHDFATKKIDGHTFKKNCIEAINLARPELEKHRGWKQILGNLALAIMGFGVLYVVAGLIHKAKTGNFLFFKTDSAKKLDVLVKTIDCIVSSRK